MTYDMNYTEPANPLERFYEYIGQLFTEEDAVMQHIQAENIRQDIPPISIKYYDGYLLQWLMRMINARTVIEIGTLGGYSGIWMARALPEDGKLITLELQPRHAEVAQANFEYADVADKVEIKTGMAIKTLQTLNAEADGPFDMVFIDADKISYPQYLEWAAEHLRVGGMIAAHNSYRRGRVLEPEEADDHELIKFHQMIADDPRLDGIIIPLGDGMTVAIKRS